MQRYVAFLRGINLGGRRPPMALLKAKFEELGFEEVATLIASGNVLFSSGERGESRVESRIAGHLESSLGYPVDTFVRTTGEVAAISGAKVFPDQDQPGITTHVGFLQNALAPAVARALSGVRTPDDALRVIGREYYWLCRVRTTDSKVWQLPEVRALKLPTSTMRNMTSIKKLVAFASLLR